VKTTKRTFILLSIVIGSSLLAQDAPLMDETVHPLYFETLSYPLSARLTHVQGVVVVRATLDSEGKVVSATAISGAKSLIPDCLSNAKKWLFQPIPEKTVVIVYHFKIEGLCNLPCPSQFIFSPPNLATITMGNAVVDHLGNDGQK
jgi:TonB family protein